MTQLSTSEMTSCAESGSTSRRPQTNPTLEQPNVFSLDEDEDTMISDPR